MKDKIFKNGEIKSSKRSGCTQRNIVKYKRVLKIHFSMGSAFKMIRRLI